MKIGKDEWSFYFPEDGETRDDLVPIIGAIGSAQQAAEEACEYDFSSRDGWERSDRSFTIMVVSPKGVETAFNAWHEPTVTHRVRAK